MTVTMTTATTATIRVGEKTKTEKAKERGGAEEQ